MAVFPTRPAKPTPLSNTIKKYPGLFGVPFVLLMVAASYGLTTFTQTRYDLHDEKVKHVSEIHDFFVETLWTMWNPGF